MDRMYDQTENRPLDFSTKGGSPNLEKQTSGANVDTCVGSLFFRRREEFKMIWDLEMETV